MALFNSIQNQRPPFPQFRRFEASQSVVNEASCQGLDLMTCLLCIHGILLYFFLFFLLSPFFLCDSNILCEPFSLGTVFFFSSL